MSFDPELLPHVKFKGFNIYMVEGKINTIKEKGEGEYWTISQIQREFKCLYNAAVLLVEYLQDICVLGEETNKYYGLTAWQVL